MASTDRELPHSFCQPKLDGTSGASREDRVGVRIGMADGWGTEIGGGLERKVPVAIITPWRDENAGLCYYDANAGVGICILSCKRGKAKLA